MDDVPARATGIVLRFVARTVQSSGRNGGDEGVRRRPHLFQIPHAIEVGAAEVLDRSPTRGIVTYDEKALCLSLFAGRKAGWEAHLTAPHKHELGIQAALHEPAELL